MNWHSMALTKRTTFSILLAQARLSLMIVLLASSAPQPLLSSRIGQHSTHRMLLQNSQFPPAAPLMPQIFILSCPGNPGCPGEPPIPANPTLPASNNSTTQSSSNTSAGSQNPSSSGGFNTSTSSPPSSPSTPPSPSSTPSPPASGSSGGVNNASGTPAQPDPPRADELLPEELLRLLATSSGQLQPDEINISLAVEGVSPVDFNYKYKALIIAITAYTTGTKGYSWNLNFQQQQATQTGRRLLQLIHISSAVPESSLHEYLKLPVGSSRHLLQPPPLLPPSGQVPAAAPPAVLQGDSVLVSLSIYTVNPQLVWYRLSRPPTQIPADGANTTGCGIEYCVALLNSGIPLLSSSIQITPSYTNVLRGNIRDGTTLDAISAQIQANRQLLDNARQYIGYVVGPLLAVLLLLLLWCQRQRIVSWFRPKSRRHQGTSRSNKWRSDTDSSSISTDSDEARDADPRDLAIVPHRPKHTRKTKKSSRSPSASSPRSTVTVASSSSRASSGAPALPGRSITPWSLARAGDDSTSSVRSEDLEITTPMERMSAADGAASENGSAITIRDFITENPQQRWQTQPPTQWSKNLTALEKDVIERYFGRMQQSVEMMQKPGSVSQGRPGSEAADHDHYDDQKSDDDRSSGY